VLISARWTPTLVSITIEDDGPGFAPGILDRLGDPYLSGQSTQRRLKGDPGSGLGLGLGLFIAKPCWSAPAPHLTAEMLMRREPAPAFP